MCGINQKDRLSPETAYLFGDIKLTVVIIMPTTNRLPSW